MTLRQFILFSHTSSLDQPSRNCANGNSGHCSTHFAIENRRGSTRTLKVGHISKEVLNRGATNPAKGRIQKYLYIFTSTRYVTILPQLVPDQYICGFTIVLTAMIVPLNPSSSSVEIWTL